MTRHTTSTAPTRDAAEGAGRVHAADPRAAAPSATTAAPAHPTYVEWTEEDWAPYEARVRAELEEQGIDFEPSPEQIERTLRLLRSPIGRVS